MKALLILATGIALLGIAGAGNSNHGCNGNVIEVGGVAYVDDRDFFNQGLWIYAESNGTPGLQSGGTAVTGAPLQDLGLVGATDPCSHPNPDTAIF